MIVNLFKDKVFSEFALKKFRQNKLGMMECWKDNESEMRNISSF